MSVYRVRDQVAGARRGTLTKPTVRTFVFPLQKAKVAGSQGFRVHSGHTGGMVCDSIRRRARGALHGRLGPLKLQAQGT